MEKFRKKPVVIEAVQLNEENFVDITNWIGKDNLADGTDPDERTIEIVTLEGNHMARLGDWIIQGIAGEYYPCKHDIFVATYDPVDGSFYP